MWNKVRIYPLLVALQRYKNSMEISVAVLQKDGDLFNAKFT